MRRYIIDNALMWLRDYHVDGLRLDAVHALVDNRAMHLLEEMAVEVDALSAAPRPAAVPDRRVGPQRSEADHPAGGGRLRAHGGQWNDDFHHVLHVALTGETGGYYADFGSMAAIAKVLTRGFFHDGTLLVASAVGTTAGRSTPQTTEAWRFVGVQPGPRPDRQPGRRRPADRASSTTTTWRSPRCWS